MGRIVPNQVYDCCRDNIGYAQSYRSIWKSSSHPAFHNELIQELLRLCAIEQSFATAYSSEENGIVERANQEVL